MSVHGADHPGIVAAVTRVLADAGVNVCDLQTRLARDLYVMIIDVAVPPEPGLEALDAALQAVAAEQGVALTAAPRRRRRPLIRDVLLHPHPLLTRRAEPATDPDRVVADLLDTMRSLRPLRRDRGAADRRVGTGRGGRLHRPPQGARTRTAS